MDAGDDSADGGAGTDECEAETEVSCEADPPAATAISSALDGLTRFKASVAESGRVARIRW
jgi:hypothetical protein